MSAPSRAGARTRATDPARSVLLQLRAHTVEYGLRRSNELGARQRLAVAGTRGCDHADLGDRKIVVKRIATIGLDARDHDQVLVAAESRRERPLHLAWVLDVNIVVDDAHE